MPNGASWTVTIDGQTKNSTLDSIEFEVTNGAHQFVITSSNEYTTSPSSGILIVNFSNLTQKITFNATTKNLVELLIVPILVGGVIIMIIITAIILYRRKQSVRDPNP